MYMFVLILFQMYRYKCSSCRNHTTDRWTKWGYSTTSGDRPCKCWPLQLWIWFHMRTNKT